MAYSLRPNGAWASRKYTRRVNTSAIQTAELRPRILVVENWPITGGMPSNRFDPPLMPTVMPLSAMPTPRVAMNELMPRPATKKPFTSPTPRPARRATVIDVKPFPKAPAPTDAATTDEKPST